MSIWNCPDHGLHGPSLGNACPKCGKPMEWSTITITGQPQPQVTFTGEASPSNVTVFNFPVIAAKALADRWADPEFWKDRGCRMDSQDCAKELLIALGLAPEST